MIKNSSLFIIFEIINKLIPFFLLPLFTYYLTPHDYGLVISFMLIVSFAAIFTGLSGNGAIDSNFFRFDKKQLSIYIANILIILAFTTIVFLIVVIIFSNIIEKEFNIVAKWQVLAVVIAFCQFIILINSSLLVIEQKPIQFGMYQLLQTVLVAVISVFLVVIESYGWKGQIIGIAIGTAISSVIALITLFRRGYMSLKIEVAYIKDFFSFGLPMIPHQIGTWIRSQGDKLIVVYMLGASTAGLFAVGYQFGIIMSVLMSSATKAIYPALFKLLNKGNIVLGEKKRIIFVTYSLFTIIVLTALTIMIILEYIYPYIIDTNFQQSIYVAKLVIISFMLEGFYYCVVGYLFYFKKTALLAKTTFSISIFHVLLSILLTYLYGVNGAGYALITSGVIQFITVWHLSNKIYPLPWFSFWKKNEIR